MNDEDFYLESARLLNSQEESDEEARVILEEMADTSGPIIDLGCGHGRHLFGMRGCGRLVIGVDLHPKSAHLAMQYAPVMLADFTCLPFPGGTFAGAVAWCNAFGSLPETDFEPFFRETHRILQYGGVFVIQGTDADAAGDLPTDPVYIEFPSGEIITEVRTWNPKTSRDTLIRTVKHRDMTASGELSVRYFNRKELTSLMSKHGFILKNMRPTHAGFVASFRKVM